MKIRRIVTGHNDRGKSGVKWDSRIEYKRGREGFEQVTLWATDSLTVKLTDEDPNTWEIGTKN